MVHTFNPFLFGIQPQMNSMLGMMQKFQEFKKNLNGNPEDIAKEMIQNGKLNKNQVEQLTQMTNQFVNMFNSSK